MKVFSESEFTRLDDINRSRNAGLDTLSRIEAPSNSRLTLKIQTYAYSGCRSLCACICHREKILTSSKWMRDIMGSLFLGYCGLPTLGGYLSLMCTETICRRNESTLIDIQYYFPFWFLQRAVFIRHSYSPLYGNQLSVNTPRAVGAPTNFFLCRTKWESRDDEAPTVPKASQPV